MSGPITDVFEHSFSVEEAVANPRLEPVPPPLRYLEPIAGKFYRPGWTARSLRGRLAVLSRRARDEIAQTRLWVAQGGQDAVLSQWLVKRLVAESLEGDGGDPVGSRVYALVTVFMLLGERGLEPFASAPIPPFSLSRRGDYRGLPAICEATRGGPVECTLPSGDPNHPFRLSHCAADRLEHFALSPVEWRRLVAIHGRACQWLGPEAYDDRGRAYKPLLAVLDKSLRPHVAPEETEYDPEDLIDRLFVEFQLGLPTRERVEILRTLKLFDAHDVAAALDRRVGQPPNVIAEGLAVRLLLELGKFTDTTLRGRWGLAHLDDADGIYAMASLAKDSAEKIGAAATIDLLIETLERLGWPSAMPDGPALYFGLPGLLKNVLMEVIAPDMLLELVLEMMNRLPTNRLGGHVGAAFEGFCSERVLDWMEESVIQPVTGDWGRTAAMNRMTWRRLSHWLDAGPPLSHVALHSMLHCLQTVSRAGPMASFAADGSRLPRLRSPLGVQEMTDRLETYADFDPLPWVKELVSMLVPSLPKIIEF